LPETGTLPLRRKHGRFEVAITIRAKRSVGSIPLKISDHCARCDSGRYSRLIESCGDAPVGGAAECRPESIRR